MAGPNGGKRPGAGRPKGRIHTLSTEFRRRVDEVSKALGVDIVKTVTELAVHPEPTVRLQACKLLMEYSYPKLKAVEQETTGGIDIRLVDPTMPAESADRKANGKHRPRPVVDDVLA